MAARLADLAVACWGHLSLGDILPLLRFADPGGEPAHPGGSAETVHRLFTEVLERLLEGHRAESAPPRRAAARPDRPLPELIDELFAGLDERQRAIARDRLYAVASRATLDELAQRFSVTRERIRQIERDLRDHVEAVADRPEAAPLDRPPVLAARPARLGRTGRRPRRGGAVAPHRAAPRWASPPGGSCAPC